MSMAKLRGVDLVIMVNTGDETTPVWSVVGGQRSATISETVETLDATTKDSDPGTYDYEYGLYTWTISCEGIYIPDDASYQLLKTAMRGRQKVKVRIQEAGTATEEGYAILTSRELEAPYEDMATYSVEMQGTGQLQALA